MAQRKRRITAEDLYRMELISDPQISPDGRSIIFSVQRVDAKTEKKYTNLWLVPAVGRGAARQFTYGNQTDRQPRWSPDGRSIAFLSNRKEAKQFQLYLIPIGGGEARPLTDLQGNFANFEWSPDGSQIAFAFCKKDKDAIEREKDKQKKTLGVVARHITRAGYKHASGYQPKEQFHIWKINAHTGKTTQLTDGGFYGESNPRWSPDGKHLLFLSNRSPNPAYDDHLVDLYIILATKPSRSEEYRKVEAPLGKKFLASFSPDGKWIAYLGREGRGNVWHNTALFLVSTDGSGPGRNLSASVDVEVENNTLTDTNNQPTLPPIWSADSQHIYVHVGEHGRVDLRSVSITDSKWQMVLKGGVVGAYSFDACQERLTYWYGNINDLGQIWVYERKTGTTRRRTRFNENWLRRVELGQIEEVWFKGADNNDLQGWILKPPDFEPHRKYPSILEIHGGPWSQYGDVFMHEFYYLAAHNYVVYFSNPRGGAGYGEAHSQSIHRNWGVNDYKDIMVWADYMTQQPYIDTERMGITGGSYGGYMTTWTIGHTDRFKAAVAQRVLSNALSFWGSSDMGYFFADVWSGKPPWEDFEAYWNQSPIKFVGNVQTPTLVIHSEEDYRCRLEQGEQLFLALQELGVESEMVLFPGEAHGLSRMGRTDRRIVRLNHILRWFDTYL